MAEQAEASPGPAEGRLMVIANRLPVTLRRAGSAWQTERSAGGLASAMDPILKKTEGLWIGWPGNAEDAGDPARESVIDGWAARDGLIAVDLPGDLARHFYEGYSNQTIWPLFHYFPDRFTLDPKGWAAYETANRLFRDAAVKHYREGDLIWVHDYQLMLLPKLLREALPDARIGFFLHIPFPSSEVFRILPERDRILEGLLGADLLAFQTHSHRQHFRSSLLRVLGVESRFEEVDAGGRAVRLEALPIGIAPEEFTRELGRRETAAQLEDLEGRYEGRKVLLAVDRLDYTKGIPERLGTFKRLLERAPQLHGTVVLIQVAIPSREEIFSYKALRGRVNELVGEINGQFGTPDWTPVIYIRRGIARAQLVALYARADVAWITPLRDGMNLVAKEYVACQRGGNGVLLLSEFAGAAEEMGEAFLVNPYHADGTAAALEAALSLPETERERRMRALHDRVHRNSVFAWGEQFLARLREAAAKRDRTLEGKPAALEVRSAAAAYRSARRRALFLDYDGTLAPFAGRPEEAGPGPELMELLERLAADGANCVMLVSGRRRSDMESWFGAVPRLWLAGEHGAVMRKPGAEWEILRPGYSGEWMGRVRPVLEHFVSRTSGSFIEEKEFSLTWHYRQSEARFAEWLAHELVAMLEEMLAETELRAIRGHKTVEIRPLWIHKGEVVERVAEECGTAGFAFAAGDDRTDEDLFKALPADAWTVHVGGGISRARFALPDPAAVTALLGEFVG